MLGERQMVFQGWSKRVAAVSDPAVIHALYRLADYPVLALLARGRTDTTKLDGRACFYIYTEAAVALVLSHLSPRELDFMPMLGVETSSLESPLTSSSA